MDSIHVETYSLYGFPYAFQVWAYETISTLSTRVALRLNDDAIPRLLRWSCTYSRAFNVLEREVFENVKSKVVVRLEATDVERQHMARVMHPPVTPVGPPAPTKLATEPLSTTSTTQKSLVTGEVGDPVELDDVAKDASPDKINCCHRKGRRRRRRSQSISGVGSCGGSATE
ncbi:uncharacterized protein LOC111008328 [Momordica charantia]|uniref:Uncharacterized protein LOC111008328 n=1 Tax=Momordica charantia TaxID=3673 RepID=A0A6J1C463_MOMCH|nr:uncharacterized protein LOC111008328 [Momordica charantia]